jgi:DNA-binding beta-propeller fold protein YncE
MRDATVIVGLCLAASVFTTACALESSDSLKSPNSSDTSGYDTQETTEPEQPEQVFTYLAPRSSRDYVFVANESLDTVSKIDADSLEITSISVGQRPTRLEAVDGHNNAVVLCHRSQQLTIIRADASLRDGEWVDETTFVDLNESMNELVLSPDGRFAFTYFSSESMEPGDPLGNLQTLLMIPTDKGMEQVLSYTVGFRVRAIQFSNLVSETGLFSTQRAFIITDTGISIIDFDDELSSRLLPVLPLSPDPLAEPLGREVYVTPSGQYAAVRDVGVAALYLLRLSDGAIQTIELPERATDIDVFPNPSALVENDRLLVLVREANMVLDIPVESAFESGAVAVLSIEAGDLPKGLASLSADGRYAILYSTLTQNKSIIIFDFDTNSYQELPLSKAASAVLVAPDNAHAIVMHPVEQATPSSDPVASYVASMPGYSIVELESGFSRLALSRIPASSMTFWNGDLGSFAYLAFNDEESAVAVVDAIDLNSLELESFEMASPPTDLGRLSGRSRIWVNQDHPLGRLSFLDVAGGLPKTITGFELNRLTR